jgi:lipopolysaccharide transport system permease protein
MELHITARRLSMRDSLRELVAYRDLLWILASREISVRYKQTAIGFLWVILQPVIATVLFTLIFGHFAKLSSDGMPYGLFSFCGMTIWGLFSNSLGRAGLSVIADEKLVTKVYFPRAVIPLASIVSAGVDFLVTFVLLLIVACFYGYPPGLALPAVIPALLITFLASAGLGMALAGWTVRYRDFRYIVPFFLQIMMYAAPIVYARSIIPPHFRLLFYLNPMTGATDLFRFGITGRPSVDFQEIGFSAGIAVALFIGGAFVFRQVEQSFADNI